MMEVTYTNKHHKTVSTRQIEFLDYYIKLSFKRGGLKIRETYDNQELVDLEYFIHADEQENIILDELGKKSSIDEIEIITTNILGNKYVAETIKVFKDKQVVEIYKKLFFNTEEYRLLGRQDYLCIQSIDLNTGLPDLADTQKYFYFYELEEKGQVPYLEAYYNEDGSLGGLDHFEVSDSHDSKDGRTQYTPDEALIFRDLLPENPDYYMNATFEPI